MNHVDYEYMLKQQVVVLYSNVWLSQISENSIVGHTRANESNSSCILSDESRHAPWICRLRLGPLIMLVNYSSYKGLAEHT